MIYEFLLRRFLYFLKEHSELCDWKKDEKIPIKNIKHAKVFIVIVKNYSNVEFIEVPFIALVKDFKIMELKIIPTGNSKEDVELRKKIIKDFYKQWERNNPSKKLYNYNLKDYINVRLISI